MGRGAQSPLKVGHRTPQLSTSPGTPGSLRLEKTPRLMESILQSFDTTKLLKEHSRPIFSYHPLLRKPWLLLQMFVV